MMINTYLIVFLLGFFAHMCLAMNKDTRRDKPLHIACRKGNVKSVKLLLDSGADPNVFNYFGQTPLLLACSSDSACIVKMLLDKNAEANDAQVKQFALTASSDLHED